MTTTGDRAPGSLHQQVLGWYADHARELPWRDPSASSWAVMVSEFMLQQTPVSRVLPVFEQWMRTWPTPSALAAAGSGDAVRAWGRLGYPRRALRLHQAATAIVAEHDGQVPSGLADLQALSGVGAYTAAAVASFAFGQRHVVLDTNVRRVITRLVVGAEFPVGSVTAAERSRAAELLPADDATAAAWAVATMELGALVCTASSPRCESCPVRNVCAWRGAGFDGPRRRGQTYAGTDRQCRGSLLAVLRETPGPVHRSRLDVAWPDQDQRTRCLTSLVEDGLVRHLAESEDTFTL